MDLPVSYYLSIETLILDKVKEYLSTKFLWRATPRLYISIESMEVSLGRPTEYPDYETVSVSNFIHFDDDIGLVPDEDSIEAYVYERVMLAPYGQIA